MRVFVTGAGGYLGLPLCRRLVERGEEVHALVRPEGRGRDDLAELGVTLHEGDVTDRYSMRVGMAGADWVLHLAGLVRAEGDAASMRRVNVEGTGNVVSLAWKLGVGRVLHVSSMAAFGGSRDDGSPVDEGGPYRERFPSLYGATKRGGDLAALEWRERGLKLNIVWPGLVYGPPGKPVGSNATLAAMASGKLPAIVGGDRVTSWVFLDDVVDGMVRVVDRAPPGRDFLLTGERIRVAELVGRVARLGGRKPPRLRVPLVVARLLAGWLPAVYRATGRRPPLDRGEVENLARHWNFEDRRAREELGWRPRGLDEGLPVTVAHLLGGAAGTGE